MIKKCIFMIAAIANLWATPTMLNASQQSQEISAATVAQIAAIIAAAAQPAMRQAPTDAQEPYPTGWVFPTDMAAITPEEEGLLSVAHPLMSHLGIAETQALMRVSKRVRKYMQSIIRGNPVIHNTLVRFRETYNQPIIIRPNLDDASNFDVFAQQLYAQLKEELSGKAGSRISINLNEIDDLASVKPDMFANFVRTIHHIIADNNCFLIGFHANNIGLEELDKTIFAGMQDLEEIDLSENNIDDLSRDIFKGLTKLKHVWLFQVKGDPTASNAASRARTANSSETPLVLDDLANLRLLDLAEFGHYKRLPDTMFDGLKKLEVLTLHFNYIATIQPRLFQQLSNLHILDLGLVFGNIETPLALHKDSLRNLKELRSLNLCGCNLKDLPPDIFSELTKLEDLDLSENGFETFHAMALHTMPNLTFLRVNRCPLKELPENALRGLPRLKKLDLSLCKLRRLPEHLFQNTTQLEELDLSCNNLTDLPDGIFRNLSRLTMLSMVKNNFTVEPLEALARLPGTCNVNETGSEHVLDHAMSKKFNALIPPRYASKH